jgi:hypothetical protein
MGDQSTPDPIAVPADSGSSRTLGDSAVTDDDAVMEAAYRIAVEVRVRQTPPSYRWLYPQSSLRTTLPKGANPAIRPTPSTTLYRRSPSPTTKVPSVVFNPLQV